MQQVPVAGEDGAAATDAATLGAPETLKRKSQYVAGDEQPPSKKPPTTFLD